MSQSFVEITFNRDRGFLPLQDPLQQLYQPFKTWKASPNSYQSSSIQIMSLTLSRLSPLHSMTFAMAANWNEPLFRSANLDMHPSGEPDE